jgi:hypothetical protein
LNEILNSILYCCENLNRKIYSNKPTALLSTSTLDNSNTKLSNNLSESSLTNTLNSDKTNSIHKTNFTNASNLEKLQTDYKENVVKKLEQLKKILSEMQPINYKLEILENIYSLIYVTFSDLKEQQDDDDDEEEGNDFEENANNNPEININDNKLSETEQEYEKDGYDIINEYPPTLTRPKIFNKICSRDETVELSIYEPSDVNKGGSKSTLGSCYSYNISNSGSSARFDDDDYDHDDQKKKNNKMLIYKRNAGGGGPFLCNDFICRDILIFLQEILKNQFSNISKLTNLDYDANSLNCSISNLNDLQIRAEKLTKIVQDTLFRFQLIKSDQVKMEYGQVGLLSCSSANHDSSLSTKFEQEQNLVYALLKKRKRSSSTSSLYSSFAESSNFNKNFGLTKNRTQTILGSTLKDNANNQNRRSGGGGGAESQRSLSLILPKNSKSKRSNSIIMKLIASVETLSALLLKESKIHAANQLAKHYASESFEFRQILFHSIYEETIKELNAVNNFNKPDSTLSLLEMSKQSLDLSQIVDKLLKFEQNNTLLQSLFLVDILSVTKFDTNNSSLYSNLFEYARVKLNQTYENTPQNNGDQSDGFLKFEQQELRRKLTHFIETSACLTSEFSDKNLSDLIFDLNGVQFGLNTKNQINNEQAQNLIEKFYNLESLKTKLNEFKSKFETQTASIEEKHEIYLSLMNFVNEKIRLGDNENLITSFYYKQAIVCAHKYSNHDSNHLSADTGGNENVSKSFERSMSLRVPQDIPKFDSLSLCSVNNNSSAGNGSALLSTSNYLLSFYEYCKILYEYFKEKSSSIIQVPCSYFSILNSSPASLICKLIFEDALKPNSIEFLTQKLNLNLTAIILHNSCPRLKLNQNQSMKNTLPVNNSYSSNLFMRSLSHNASNTNYNKDTFKLMLAQNINQNNSNNAKFFNSEQFRINNYYFDIGIFDLASFYMILNHSDINSCSRKKPHEFLRDLLLKLLKYCKNFLNERKEHPTGSSMTNTGSIDLDTAREIYQCSQFKQILNESQELQHLNLFSLKDENQKLSFFINLHNLLSIHAHFYLAWINSNLMQKQQQNQNHHINPTTVDFDDKIVILNEQQGSIGENDNFNEKFFLFRNKTERLLFEQKMCYKVGQMGYLSLYDLKHLILTRHCMNNDSFSNINYPSFTVPNNISKAVHTLNSGGGNGTTTKRSIFRKKLQINNAEKSGVSPSNNNTLNELINSNKHEPETELFKYAYFNLDMEVEPLWSQFLPSESSLDYRILFALTNCSESDPPICVFNSDDLVQDQLKMQMRLFLNDSIHVNLTDDILYLPEFIIQNCSFFIDDKNGSGKQSANKFLIPFITNVSMENDSNKNDLETLVRFLMEYLNDELKNNMKSNYSTIFLILKHLDSKKK